MRWIDVILFASVPLWLVCAASMFVPAIEFAAAERMKAWAFRVGPVVLRQTVTPSVVEHLPGPHGNTGALGYRKLGDGRWLVRTRAWFPGLVPLVGMLRPAEGVEGALLMTGRAPLGALVFWASSWANAVYLVGSCLALSQQWWLAGATSLAGLLLCLGPGVLWIRVERRRLARQLELLSHPV